MFFSLEWYAKKKVWNMKLEREIFKIKIILETKILYSCGEWNNHYSGLRPKK